MLKPSKRHFLIYDAQTFEESGFIKVAGNVSQMAQKPQFWQISITPKTTDGEVIDKDNFKFTTKQRAKLNELSPIINDFIFGMNDFLPHCISVIVCARIMTEGGV